jgi:hypothetical protein
MKNGVGSRRKRLGNTGINLTSPLNQQDTVR